MGKVRHGLLRLDVMSGQGKIWFTSVRCNGRQGKIWLTTVRRGLLLLDVMGGKVRQELLLLHVLGGQGKRRLTTVLLHEYSIVSCLSH